jgi:predicted nucleic acid-binding protein
LEVSGFYKKLKDLKSVCIDSSVLIYHLEIIKPYDVLTKALIEKISAGEIFCNISALTIAELLAKPYRLKDYSQISVFEGFISSLPNTKIQPVDYNIAKFAASLRGEYNLRTPDSIMLSTSLVTSSEAFITNDISLKKLNMKDIKILILDDYM